jgi:3-oxoacyl-[acyl-carrier protein] reductase
MPLTLMLQGRTALVTGASRGIGKAIALLLGQAGADVLVAAASRKADAGAVARAIEQMGARAAVAVGDLTDPGTPAAYVEACRAAFGQLDILVNNAGIWEGDPIERMTPEGISRTLRINLEAAMLLCREAVPLLRASKAGRIINVSSTASLMGEPGHSDYAASKGGLDAFTRSLAVELGPHRITVNSVAPGWTTTEMTAEELETELGDRLRREIPLGKVATAEDVAYAAVYLASDWAGHVSGVTLPVEGAYRIRR